MKKFLPIMILLITSSLLFGQEKVVNSFDVLQDTTYWGYEISDNADSTKSFTHLSLDTDNVQAGDAALRVDYSAWNIETWGGFAKFEHIVPEDGGFMNWSAFDSLTFWYYVEDTVSGGDVHLRFNVYEASENGPTTTSPDNMEFYYSFHYVLDQEPGWNYISMPMEADPNYWDGEGFNRTGWSGIVGNDTFDPDKIKGFGIEFSIGGAGEGNVGSGTILLDHLALKGVRENNLVFFNGFAVPGGVEVYSSWADGSTELSEEESADSVLNSLKWNTPTQSWALWDGPVFTLPEPENLEFLWQVDTLKFDIKAPSDFGDLKIVLGDDDIDSTEMNDLMFESAYFLEAAEVGYDGNWKHIEIPLRDFNRFEGGWDGSQTVPGEMDSSRVYQLKILVANEASLSKTVYLDNIWTGSPVMDVTPPEAPTAISGAASEYLNLITWLDVQGEESESYNVYYSTSPIDDIEAEGVEAVELGVPETEQLAEHRLKAPATDQSVTYYYAVTCVDAAGNVSTVGQIDAAVTNTAKGFPVISPTAPVNFAADGDLSDWSSITPMVISTEDGTGNIVANQQIDGDSDLKVTAYLAVDDTYLYAAYDVDDDVVSSDSTIASYLTDGVDLFIGLYDYRGEMHGGYERGAEPDYHFRFYEKGGLIDNFGGDFIIEDEDEDYYWGEKFPTGYIIETRIRLDSLAAMGEDEIFEPEVGMRIPLDYSINDADNTGEREGIMTLSPNNEDLSWQSVNRWTYTWIGDQWTDVEDNYNNLPNAYTLSQNYPNPFNPTTKINYSLRQEGRVTLKIFNVLGQEVATLIDKQQNAGQYTVDFNASNLASGMYIYQLKADSFTSTKKMMLIK